MWALVSGLIPVIRTWKSEALFHHRCSTGDSWGGIVLGIWNEGCTYTES